MEDQISEAGSLNIRQLVPGVNTRRTAMNAGTIRKGAVAGALAGTMMAMFSMIVMGIEGEGFWTPVNAIAHTLWRNGPLDGTFSLGGTVLGVMMHMGLSMMLGAMVALIAERRAATGSSAVAIGVGVAAAAWVGQLVVWSAVDSAASDAIRPWIFAVSHAVFGMVAGLGITMGARQPSLRPAVRKA